jgi:hypothetical protein
MPATDYGCYAASLRTELPMVDSKREGRLIHRNALTGMYIRTLDRGLAMAVVDSVFESSVKS